MNSTDEHITTPLMTNSSMDMLDSPFTLYIASVSISIILGLPTNCYVLWLMFMRKRNEFVSDFFIFNLVLCEVVYYVGSFIGLPSVVCLRSVFVICFITGLPTTGRPLFLCLICVERYLAVLYPVTFIKFKALRYRLAFSAVAWVAVLSFSVFYMFALSSSNVQLFFYVVLPQYYFFLFIKMFCCLAVLRALTFPGPGERGRQREEANLIKRRAMRIILIITVAMFISYTPMLIAGFLYNTLSDSDFLSLWSIGVAISMIVVLVKSFMYIHKFGNLPRQCT